MKNSFMKQHLLIALCNIFILSGTLHAVAELEIQELTRHGKNNCPARAIAFTRQMITSPIAAVYHKATTAAYTIYIRSVATIIDRTVGWDAVFEYATQGLR